MLPAAEWCAAGKRFSLAPPPGGGPDLRSDSVDITTTRLRIDISDFAAQTIDATAVISFAAKVDGLSEIRLDLLDMTVSDVASSLNPVWTYDGSQLRITWPVPLHAGDTASLMISYHGRPAQDASGWGGFYWQGDYAYNLGVGFAADPHSYGRAWFPCFDNFVERCKFMFDIYTPAGKPAYCNGVLLSEGPWLNGKIRRTWLMANDIPSYLACVAVGPFTTFTREYNSENGSVPLEIAVAPADSNRLKASFVHLPDALATFENWYGPYRWSKIGYSIVPFNQGAMEHATNIAYMRDAVDGTTASETLMAHEFSHHWWGDLATCSTAGDMWLNEGWAVFSEHLFLEALYGPERYRDAVRSNFLNVLESAHVREGGYRAVSGIPQEYTYGQHVYNKGAAVAHNLRGYLGDTLFRSGLREALAATQFDDWNSAGLRDRLSAATGYDLGPFFDDWVFSPGFTHFSVDSVRMVFSPVDAPTQVFVSLKQKLRGAPHFYQNVPLECTLVDPFGNRQYRSALVSGENSTVLFEVPAWFFVQKVWVNTRLRLTLARADEEITAKELISYNFSPAKLTIKINGLPSDSALIRVEHHYVMPDTAGAANPDGYRFTNRYWSIDALGNFDGDANFIYDGKGKLDQLDTELFAQTGPSEDSIVLLYRPAPGFAWQPCPNSVKNTIGSAQDRYGLLRALHVQPGQYTIAKGRPTVSVDAPEAGQFAVTVAPNPGRDLIRIKAGEPFNGIMVFDSGGRLVSEFDLAPASETELRTAAWPAGMYRIVLFGARSTAAASFQRLP